MCTHLEHRLQGQKSNWALEKNALKTYLVAFSGLLQMLDGRSALS